MINLIATITKFKADISPCIIASLFWKKITTIAITTIKSLIATAKRIIFFISSNIPISIHQKNVFFNWLKSLWVSLTLKNENSFFSVFDTPVGDTRNLLLKNKLGGVSA